MHWDQLKLQRRLAQHAFNLPETAASQPSSQQANLLGIEFLYSAMYGLHTQHQSALIQALRLSDDTQYASVYGSGNFRGLQLLEEFMNQRRTIPTTADTAGGREMMAAEITVGHHVRALQDMLAAETTARRKQVAAKFSHCVALVIIMIKGKEKYDLMQINLGGQLALND